MKTYANYRGFQAELKEDGTLYNDLFDVYYKSIKGFKKWCTIHSYKWLSKELFNKPFEITQY